ncbi:MAG: 50S ribosomal protein L9 [Acidobacteria bacterium]|nr:50S ribosomal protein L9 [Acidobacteriota bacterium]MBU4328910.1 50S ribosomal protein L9 [Acidobacteriota bacterium]MCG2816766.1 50S ribosomal protein L9 [Candidatus Aminicenantes bacterium]
MKIILKENIENLGKRGDIVNVAAGYGRNYLLPKKLAIQVTPSNLKMIELEQKALRKKLEKEMASYNEIIGRMNGVTLTFKRKVAEKDTLFGSVSVADIREALMEAGFEIEKKKILLLEPIKTIGEFTVPVKVFHDDKAEVKIIVLQEGAEKKAKAKEPSIEAGAEEDPAPEDVRPDDQVKTEPEKMEKEAEEPEDAEKKD